LQRGQLPPQAQLDLRKICGTGVARVDARREDRAVGCVSVV
jgi:hypothetical protein